MVAAMRIVDCVDHLVENSGKSAALEANVFVAGLPTGALLARGQASRSLARAVEQIG